MSDNERHNKKHDIQLGRQGRIKQEVEVGFGNDVKSLTLILIT